MVSPSKLQQQQQQELHKHRQQQQHNSIQQEQQHQKEHRHNQPLSPRHRQFRITSATANKPAASRVVPSLANKIRIQKGPKPLDKKIFYLDVKNHTLSSKLETKIKELGGAIELFLIKNVSVVISDRYDKANQITNSSSDQRRWGYASAGSGGPPSLRSIEIQTPTPTPPTSFRSVEGPLSNSNNQRGQPTHRSKSRVDAMLERALTQPQQCSVDPLSNALNWGIPIWSTYELQAWLEKIIVSLKDSQSIKQDTCARDKSLKVKHLKEPYIKFESYRRESRPVFVELQSWPTFNFDGDPGSCPFDIKGKEGDIAINKEIKENKEKYFNSNITKGKDMTRRPRATATRARKTENTGYCGICRIDYRNLAKHLQSDQHLSFVQNEKNFLSLDNLIGTGASVEAFLKINRTKDVSKECNLFSNQNHSLDNGIFSSSNEKSEKKDKSNLSEFNLDEIKMIECNGARRNLSLKLDSPHNLRTRIKHESGHLLRSKGRPWSEEEKHEKSFDKYTIKKRAKGTIWIEEEDSEEEKNTENLQVDVKSSFERFCESGTKKSTNNGENSSENILINGDICAAGKDKEANLNKIAKSDNALAESLLDANLKTKVNGYEKKEEKHKIEVLQSGQNNDNKKMKLLETNTNSRNDSVIISGEKIAPIDNEDTNSLRSIKSVSKEDRGKSKIARRGGRSYRGRHRLSVEERLIEDNRDYYKVEVLGNKLRSSAIPSNSIIVSPSKEQIDKSKKDDNPSSEKPVVVRFKRVRKSELSLLSDEAESFMFGDPRRDDESSENSDGEQSSILPKDTESEHEETVNSFVVSSSPSSIHNPLKKEAVEDESQESITHGRARKRRRTQTEALIMDNTDYYKFETPGSRLRFQAPLTGISEPALDKEFAEMADMGVESVVEKTYPSKPSPEIEKMHFSFEAVPKSEPWYQTYQRQDEGAEFWHYFSESDSQKPFLLPYEIENFQESLQKILQSGVHRKRGRSRGGHVNVGVRSPRKSPRCHASTLAIMSTIIKKREQQTSTLSTIEEESKTKCSNETAKSEKKCSEKSDVDEDLKEIVKNLDEMLSSNDMQDLESFEADLLKNPDDVVLEPETLSRGAPANLLELLDNCHETVAASGIENSSCASSECGEPNHEFPLKRRKKRKNKTGWPGNKMRRKLQIKQLSEEVHKELCCEKNVEGSVSIGKRLAGERNLPIGNDSPRVANNEEDNEEGNVTDPETGKENEQMNKESAGGKRTKCGDSKDNLDVKELEEIEGINVLKSVSGDEITTRRRPHDEPDKCNVEEERRQSVEEIRQSEAKGRLSSISEDSEASMSNNENLCEKDTNSLLTLEKQSSLKKFSQKRKRSNTISSNASHHMEVENRRKSTLDSSLKKGQQQLGGGQDQSVDLIGKANKCRKKSKKHQSRNNSPAKLMFDNEECKKESLLTANERKRLKRIKGDGSASSEIQNSELDSMLSERVSPSFVASSDVDQRRSSIDFQPVVRVMKIEDQVDMDNSVLSVTVASNRRLRSSSSPRSNMQPPNKRFRHASRKRQFSGQWIKNS